MPETVSEILAFLSSRAVKGIGPKMAEKIVSRFGEQSLNVLEQDFMQLTQIPGISEKRRGKCPKASRSSPASGVSSNF